MGKNLERNVLLNLQLPAAMARALKMEAAMMGVTVSSVIRQLIEKWLPDDYKNCYNLGGQDIPQQRK